MYIRKKNCVVCGREYQPTGRCSKFCGDACRHVVAKKHAEKYWRKSSRYKGCGSGGNQASGPEDSSWVHGRSTIEKFKKGSCERCGSTKELCKHHRDHNRNNNVEENIETLCKRCHQLHHKCWENLPKEVSEESRKAASRRMKKLLATAERDKLGRVIKMKSNQGEV